MGVRWFVTVQALLLVLVWIPFSCMGQSTCYPNGQFDGALPFGTLTCPPQPPAPFGDRPLPPDHFEPLGLPEHEYGGNYQLATRVPWEAPMLGPVDVLGKPWAYPAEGSNPHDPMSIRLGRLRSMLKDQAPWTHPYSLGRSDPVPVSAWEPTQEPPTPGSGTVPTLGPQRMGSRGGPAWQADPNNGVPPQRYGPWTHPYSAKRVIDTHQVTYNVNHDPWKETQEPPTLSSETADGHATLGPPKSVPVGVSHLNVQAGRAGPWTHPYQTAVEPPAQGPWHPSQEPPSLGVSPHIAQPPCRVLGPPPSPPWQSAYEPNALRGGSPSPEGLLFLQLPMYYGYPLVYPPLLPPSALYHPYRPDMWRA